MKNILFVLFFLFISFAQAKVTVDSTTFEEQRAKVNSLLDERTQKFGEFDISLTKKTGIFGLFKTNGDMQKSMDILHAIIKHDNKIFIETRKLLAIKDAHAEKYEQLADEYDNQVTAYMKTISKLQAENEKLRLQFQNFEEDDRSDNGIIFFLVLLVLTLLFFIFKLKKQLNSKKLTQL